MASATETEVGRLSSARMPALDGLRGLAALAVLVSHCMLLFPAVATAFDAHGRDVHGVVWWVTFTPFHALWAGSEAVAVFFVLSGFVLTRAAAGMSFSWRAYYPSRLLRLYLPVAGALAFALVSIAVFPRHAVSSGSWWLDRQQHVSTTLRSFLHCLSLLKGSELLLPVLWSLKWEVIFSLLLPIAVYGASRRLSLALLQAAALLALTVYGSDSTASQLGYLLYLPMFGIGALMAHQHERLSAAGLRLRGPAGFGLALAAIVLLMFSWTAQDQSRHAYRPALVVGAALLVFSFGYWDGGRSFGETRVLQWLGKRSFSLYLVHYPIVVGSAFLLGSHSRYAFVVAVPLALVAADLFFRGVEGPSHRISRYLKGRLTPRRRERGPATSQVASSVSLAGGTSLRDG